MRGNEMNCASDISFNSILRAFEDVKKTQAKSLRKLEQDLNIRPGFLKPGFKTYHAFGKVCIVNPPDPFKWTTEEEWKQREASRTIKAMQWVMKRSPLNHPKTGREILEEIGLI